MDIYTRYEATIRRVDNGFIVRTVEETEDGEYSHEIVFEDIESEYGSRHSMVAALLELVDYFGEIGGRYDKERIHIELKPGDKCNLT